MALSCRLYSDEHEHWEINEEATEARWVKTTAAHLAVGDHAGLASAGRQLHATSEVKVKVGVAVGGQHQMVRTIGGPV